MSVLSSDRSVALNPSDHSFPNPHSSHSLPARQVGFASSNFLEARHGCRHFTMGSYFEEVDSMALICFKCTRSSVAFLLVAIFESSILAEMVSIAVQAPTNPRRREWKVSQSLQSHQESSAFRISHGEFV